MQEFSIGDVMKITGLSRATILYYESKNLIHPRQEKESGYRKYSIDDLSGVMFYQNMKQMDVSVGEYALASGKTDNVEGYDVETLLMMKKQECLKKLSAYMAMIRFWDQALDSLRSVYSNSLYCSIQDSYETWTLDINNYRATQGTDMLKNWDKYFLQRNLSYFFRLENVQQGDYSFHRGLSCYADCCMRTLNQEKRNQLRFIPCRRCLAVIVPFDYKEENFLTVFEELKSVCHSKKMRMCGDPWGHFSTRDDKKGINYLFLWIPVEEK